MHEPKFKQLKKNTQETIKLRYKIIIDAVKELKEYSAENEINQYVYYKLNRIQSQIKGVFKAVIKEVDKDYYEIIHDYNGLTEVYYRFTIRTEGFITKVLDTELTLIEFYEKVLTEVRYLLDDIKNVYKLKEKITYIEIMNQMELDKFNHVYNSNIIDFEHLQRIQTGVKL